ncbi:hypothetical protein V2J09_011955 [Rumex salicifolius]
MMNMNSRLIMLRPTIPSMLFPSYIKSKTQTSVRAIHNVQQNCPPPVRQNADERSAFSSTPSYLHLPTSAYIHLPFCRKRCHYCDFPIVALGLSSPYPPDNDPRMVDYINLICREIQATRPSLDTHPPLKTVFFGGGTPSLVPPRLVLMVMEVLDSKFGVCPDAEISMEMDPGTFNGEKLRELMGLGLNRVSLGVQAFQEELLKSCGRAHGVQEVYEAIEIVKSCGVKNWSLDLISSLPNQTPQMWDQSLRLTIDAQPAHVSVYDLQVEDGTKFGVLYKPGESPLPSETQSAEFYKMASKTLTDVGYVHYEISSYGKAGFECKHNKVYWENGSFYGFGLGSASYTGGLRFSRPRRMKEYSSFVQDLENGETEPLTDNEDIDQKDRAMDVVMLSLRTSRGLEIKPFSQTYGAALVESLCQAYLPYVKSGHVLFLDEQRKVIEAEELKSLLADEGNLEKMLGFIRLSDPDGFLLSNDLISVAFGVVE